MNDTAAGIVCALLLGIFAGMFLIDRTLVRIAEALEKMLERKL